MNEEYDMSDFDDIQTEEFDAFPEEPEYATKDDLRAFAEELSGGQHGYYEEEYDDPLSGYNPEFVADLRRVLADQARAIHAEYAPILSESVANQAAQLVAGDMDRDVQQYIGSMIAKMDPLAAKAMLRDPEGLEMLESMAIGRQSRQGSGGSGFPRTHEPSGGSDPGFSGSDRDGMASFMRAFGVDRKRATELYRQAQRARN